MAEFVITRPFSYRCEWRVLGTYWKVAVTMNDHMRVNDPMLGRKRVFAFMADKVTDLYRIGDAVVLLIIVEKKEL